MLTAPSTHQLLDHSPVGIDHLRHAWGVPDVYHGDAIEIGVREGFGLSEQLSSLLANPPTAGVHLLGVVDPSRTYLAPDPAHDVERPCVP